MMGGRKVDSGYRMGWRSAVVLGILFACAWGVRLIQLDARPMHTDEAVNGLLLANLLEDGIYRYNPTEYHGPALYYLTLPLTWLAGQRTGTALTETTLRLLPVFCSVALIPLLALWRRVLGSHAVCWAALFTAVSPISLYYGRYYIHESLLVFFFFAFLTCAMRYALSRRMAWALAAGAFAGLAHATKETSILMFAALAAAGLIARGCCRLIERRTLFLAGSAPRWRALGAGVLMAIAVSVIFYSSFFSNFQGVLDSVQSVFHFADRAMGQGHEKPWFTYLQWVGWSRSGGFIWTEGLLVGLAFVGFGLSVRKPSRFSGIAILLAAYALVLFVIYSILPYKTPWLMLGPMQIVAVLAGMGAAGLYSMPWAAWMKGLVVLALLAGTAHLAVQAYRAAFRFAADERVPYCYSHTSPDAVTLASRIHQALRLVSKQELRWVQIAAEEYWPLPWYLRDVENVGYWHNHPETLSAPVIVLGMTQSAAAEETLRQTHTVALTGLRPGILLALWIRTDIWNELIR
jgi:uncharacterized protein (TIGR03663 family)